MSDYSAEVEVANPPENYATGRQDNNVVVPGNIVVYGFTVYNTKSSAQYINVFDASLLPGDTAVPLFSWPVAANNGVAFAFPTNGRRFKTGLVLNNSSTDATKTIGSLDCFFDVQYERLSDLTDESKFEAY